MKFLKMFSLHLDSKLFFFLLFLFFNIPFIFSQEIEIYGLITNQYNEPLPEVKVEAVKSSHFMLSDSKGRYTIFADIDDDLVFTYENHEEFKTSVKSIVNSMVSEKAILNVTLYPKINVYDYSLEDLMRIEVVSVSKKAEKLTETPQTVVVVTQEDIRLRGYTDLEQIFHDLPGFDISRAYGTEYSQLYQRGYRSNNTDRTLFLMDGVEENDMWSGSAWIGRQFPINQIEKIEVVYGPATTVYGPNAFVGAINVVTKNVSSIIKPSKTFGVSAYAGIGTWNTWFTDVTLAAQKNKISLLLTGRIYQSDEMDLSKYEDWDYDLSPYDISFYKQVLGTESDEVASVAQALDSQGYMFSESLNGVEPKYGDRTENYYIHGKLNIQNLELGIETFKRKEGYGGWYTDKFELSTEHNAYWIPKNTFMYAKYRESITNKLTVTSFSTFRQHGIDGESKELYYNGYFNKEIDISGLIDNEGNLLPEDERDIPYWWAAYYQTYSLQLRSELRAEYEFTDRFNLIAGAEYRHSHIQGQYLVSEQEIPEETGFQEQLPGGNHFFSTDFGLFVQANYQPINNLFFVLGGRLDNNRIRKTGGYGTVFNPKAAAIYTPGNLVFKAIYSQAFKDADFWTKYGTTPGRLLNNPDLMPEKVKNFDLSAGWKLSNFIYVDLVGYHAIYDGVVGTADVSFVDEEGNTVNTTQHQAIGSLAISGAHSNINFKYDNYSGYFNYTFTNPYNTTHKKNIRIGDIASHQLNFGVSATYFKKLGINLRFNWVGERKTGKNTTINANPYDSIDPYFVVNGAVNYNIWNGITAQLSVFNIMNTEYFHPGVRSANGMYYAARVPQFERSIFVKMMVDL